MLELQASLNGRRLLSTITQKGQPLNLEKATPAPMSLTSVGSNANIPSVTAMDLSGVCSSYWRGHMGSSRVSKKSKAGIKTPKLEIDLVENRLKRLKEILK